MQKINCDCEKAKELMEKCGRKIENLENWFGMLMLSNHIDNCEKCRTAWNKKHEE